MDKLMELALVFDDKILEQLVDNANLKDMYKFFSFVSIHININVSLETRVSLTRFECLCFCSQNNMKLFSFCTSYQAIIVKKFHDYVL